MDFKASLRKLEFPSQTPTRPVHSSGLDFQSQQKLKYEQQSISSRPLGQNSSTYAKENITVVSKELYESHIPVRIKSSEREDYQTNLSIKMIINQSSQSLSLHIELTDDTNYQFLQVLDLTEGEFLVLKNEQSLHVDFLSFPHKLADLFSLCISTNKDERVAFYIAVDIKTNGETTFSVVENNEFKRLTHLSLKFKTATDDILKHFLSQKLCKEKQITEDLNSKCKKYEDTLQERLWDIDHLRQELRKFQEDRDSTVQSLILQEQKKINELKEEALYKETNFVKECETEKKIMVDKYERIVSELQMKNSKLLEQSSELLEQKNKLEASERDLLNKNRIQDKELTMITREVETLRIDNKQLDQNRFSQEKMITELQMKVKLLENQLNDKVVLMDNKKEIIDNTNKQNEFLQEQNQTYKRQIEKLENKISQCTEEINKGNQIIEKNQGDIQKLKEKIKMKNAVVLQQEQTVQQLQDQKDQQNKSLNDLKREKDNLEIKIKDLEIMNQDYKSKITESQKLIESNNQMIQYLNKCLNESKAGPLPMAPLNNTFKSQTYTKYITPLTQNTPPPSDDIFNKSNVNKNFSMTVGGQFQQSAQNQNQSQMSGTSQITNRFNF